MLAYNYMYVQLIHLDECRVNGFVEHFNIQSEVKWNIA